MSPTDELLLDTDADFPVTGLKKKFRFQNGQTRYRAKTIILGEIGEVSPTLQTEIDKKLKIALDLK